MNVFVFVFAFVENFCPQILVAARVVINFFTNIAKSKLVKNNSGFFMAITWLVADAASGVWVKASGLNRADLLFSNFAVAGVLLLTWAVLQKTPMPPREVLRRLVWVFAARCGFGLAATAAAFATFANCIGFGAALLSINPLVLMVASLFPFFKKILGSGEMGWPKFLGAGIATTGIIIGSAAASAGVCGSATLALALFGGLLLAVVATLQKHLAELPVLVNTSGYCVIAAIAIAAWSIATGHPVTLPWQGIVLGCLYAVVQVASQRANQWNPPIAGTIGQGKMPILTTASVVVFGETQPGGVWIGVYRYHDRQAETSMCCRGHGYL